MNPHYNILMTGAGAPGAAGIIFCLQSDPAIRLTVADADINAVGRYLTGDFVQIPNANEPGFVDAVLELCLQRHIHVVMPLVTKELFPLSKNRRRFEERGIHVLVSSEEAIDISNNKSQCYQFLKTKGVGIPKFFIANTLEEFTTAALKLGHPHKPFCFKPSISNGSRGVRIVSESLDESEHLFNYKPYNLYISYSHALKILSLKKFPQLLVSEYLPGNEYSVDCLCNHGIPELVVPRLRKKMINGISVQGEFIKDDSIISYCRKIIELLGLHGNIGIQLKYSEDDRPLLVEINPRVQGTIAAGLGAGINLPLLAVKQELGLPISPEELQVKWGTKFSRHWTEVYY